MATVPIDLSRRVFKRTNYKMEGEFSLDGQMLSALMELDGKKTMGGIADRMGLDMKAMQAWSPGFSILSSLNRLVRPSPR